MIRSGSRGGSRFGLFLSFLMGAVLWPAGVRADEARKVHALIAVDYRCNPPLPNQESNEENIVRLLNSVRVGVIPTDGPPSPYQVDRDRVSVRKIGQNGLNPRMITSDFEDNEGIGRNDVVLFYYSGHGGTDPQAGHFIHTSGGDLLRADLVAAMSRRSPRLAIILTDCCSNVGPFTPSYGVGTPETARIMRSLLFRHRGVVNITAATYDQRARRGESGWFVNYNLPDGSSAPGGGIFTMSLSHTIENTPHDDLDRDRDGWVSWRELIPPLRETMDRNYRAMKRSGLSREPRNAEERDNQDALRGQETQQPWVIQPIARFEGGDVVPDDRPPTKRRRYRFGVDIRNHNGRGVVIQSVVADSPASRVTVHEIQNGVRTTRVTSMIPGDLIQSVNGQPVRNLDDYFNALDSIPRGGEMRIRGLDAFHQWRRGYTASVRLD